MMKSFEGKRVLVTGGSRGIGRATVQAFRAAGAQVAVNGRTADSTAEGIAAMGDDGLIAAPGDIGTVAGCEAAVGVALDAFGGLDVLVNSAGVAMARSVETCDEAFWDEQCGLDVGPDGRREPVDLLRLEGRRGFADQGAVGRIRARRAHQLRLPGLGRHRHGQGLYQQKRRSRRRPRRD